MLLDVVPVTRGPLGTVGGWVSPPDPPPTLRRSTLGPPFTVVAVSRTMMVPAVSAALTVTSCQVLHAPVGLNAVAGATALPLAWRMVRLAVPASAAMTVHST